MAAPSHLPLDAFARAAGLALDAVRDLVAAGRLDGVRTDDGTLVAVLADRLPADLGPDTLDRVAAAVAAERVPDDVPTGEGWSMRW